MNNIIVGMGEALWDVLPEGKKIGGAPANFAYHVSQFGFDSRVVSAVGNDELGDEIMEVFKEKQLKNQIERVDYPTGTVQVTLDDEGGRTCISGLLLRLRCSIRSMVRSGAACIGTWLPLNCL